MGRTFEFHPAAEIFPLMVGDEFKQLVADIAANGLREAITLHPDGRILDGRNRYLALREVPDVAPIFETWTGVVGTEVPYVISLNLARRHLDESQRALVAARLATLRREDTLKRGPDSSIDLSGVSQADAATLLNVSVPSLKRAKTVLSSGTPALIEAATNGHIPVSQASRIAKLDVVTQDAVVHEVVEGGRKPAEAMRVVKAAAVKARGTAALTGKYRVLYADPPWAYGNSLPPIGVRAGATEAADYYPTMPSAEIAALPIKALAEDDAVLFLWTTSPHLEESFTVINGWGFTYKASFVWDKVKHNMGHYNSVRHEFLLVAVRGSCQPDERKLFDSVVTEERTEHSKKPDQFYTIIETLYPHGARIELFARTRRDGWEAWGYEVPHA